MPKKFLDANGVTHLISLLDNYPDNALLGSVIDAIEEELDSKVSIAGDTMTGSLVVNSKITSVGLDAGTGNIITTGNISGNAITSNYDITVGHGYFIIKPYSSIYDSTGEDPGIRFYYNHDRSGILADTLFANKAISATKFYGDGSGLTNLTVMTGATSSAAGVAGIVPTPAKGKQTSFLRGDGTWVVPTNTTYTAGTGLSLSGTTFNHSNSVTASTAGTSSATSGVTAAIPYVTYDAQGHVTASGTHTHTVPVMTASTNGVGRITAGTGISVSYSSGNVTITNSSTNTDTKVNVTLGTTTKAYLLATSTTPTSTATAVTSIADTGVYLDTTAGTLVTTGKITSVGLDAGSGAISTNNTITGSSVSITGQNGLTLSRIVDNKTLQTKLFKNASNSADYGTQIIDYSVNDTTQYTRLVIRDAASTDSGKLYLTDEDQNVYYIYGEHNKPTITDVQELQTVLDNKVDKVAGKGLSTNDYTTAEKTKLAGIEAGAQVNTITGIKGNAETNYRTGNVNLTSANIGALPITGGTLTGPIAMQRPSGAPRIELFTQEKAGVGSAKTMLYKNAGDSSDNGTTLADFVWGDGSENNKSVRLVLLAASAYPSNLIRLRYDDGAGNSTIYRIYGEHYKPPLADVTGLEAALAGKSDTGHTHGAGDIISGTLNTARLPTVPITKGGTGATDALSAITALGGLSTGSIGTPMASGDNIDNYTTPGTYLSTDATISASLQGTPPYTTGGFKLYVIRGYQSGVTIQLAQGASVTVYCRIKTSSTADWGNWQTYALGGHSHDYLPLTGGTLTGDLIIQLNSGMPAFSLRAPEKEGVGRSRTTLHKDASAATDYGTWLTDYTWNNSQRTALVLRNAAAALRDRLTLRDYTESTSTTYHLFGEHNPPAVADVDGLQTALNGKSDINHTHFSATPTNNQVVVADGTDGLIKTSGYTIAKSVPNTAVFTDVKVTQTIKTDNVERPVLTAPSTQTDTTTTTAAFSTNITANASTGALTAKNLISTADCTINSGYFTIKPYSAYYDTTGNHAGIKFYFNHDRSGFNADTLITGSNLQAKIYYMNQGLYLKTNDMGEYGRLAITTLGTAGTGSANGTNGCTSLYLGNDIPLSSATTAGANNAYGRIVMYGTGTAYTILRANPNGNRTCYLPKGAETMYLTYKPSTAAVGSSSAGVFIDANGKATVTGSSDIRLKNIEGIIPDVSKISAIKFKWNESYMNRDDKEHIGYSAQDVEEIAPFLVSEDENGYKILNYTEFLCAKIQCLEEKIKQLEEKIEKRL